MPINLPKVEALFGAKLNEVTHEHIVRLVEGQVVEDADLDFKSDVHKDGMGLIGFGGQFDYATNLTRAALSNSAGLT